MEEQVLAARMNNHQKLLQKQVSGYLVKDRKQQGQINQLQEELKKSQQEVKYLHKNRSEYNKEMVEAWR